MTARFRPDNTEGYSDADLAALNAAFGEIMNANADLWANDTSPGRDLAFKSWQDNVAEEFRKARRRDGVPNRLPGVHLQQSVLPGDREAARIMCSGPVSMHGFDNAAAARTLLTMAIEEIDTELKDKGR